MDINQQIEHAIKILESCTYNKFDFVISLLKNHKTSQWITQIPSGCVVYGTVAQSISNCNVGNTGNNP